MKIQLFNLSSVDQYVNQLIGQYVKYTSQKQSSSQPKQRQKTLEKPSSQQQPKSPSHSNTNRKKDIYLIDRINKIQQKLTKQARYMLRNIDTFTNKNILDPRVAYLYMTRNKLFKFLQKVKENKRVAEVDERTEMNGEKQNQSQIENTNKIETINTNKLQRDDRNNRNSYNLSNVSTIKNDNKKPSYQSHPHNNNRNSHSPHYSNKINSNSANQKQAFRHESPQSIGFQHSLQSNNYSSPTSKIKVNQSKPDIKKLNLQKHTYPQNSNNPNSNNKLSQINNRLSQIKEYQTQEDEHRNNINNIPLMKNINKNSVTSVKRIKGEGLSYNKTSNIHSNSNKFISKQMAERQHQHQNERQNRSSNKSFNILTSDKKGSFINNNANVKPAISINSPSLNQNNRVKTSRKTQAAMNNRSSFIGSSSSNNNRKQAGYNQQNQQSYQYNPDHQNNIRNNNNSSSKPNLYNHKSKSKNIENQLGSSPQMRKDKNDSLLQQARQNNNNTKRMLFKQQGNNSARIMTQRTHSQRNERSQKLSSRDYVNKLDVSDGMRNLANLIFTIKMTKQEYEDFKRIKRQNQEDKLLL